MNASSTRYLPTAHAEASPTAHQPAAHSWQRPDEAQEVYHVLASDTALVRGAAKWFGRSSANMKLWGTALVPLVITAAISLPVLYMSRSILAAAAAQDVGEVERYAALIGNLTLAALLAGAVLSWLIAGVLYREVIRVVTDLIEAAYELLDGNTQVSIPFLDRRDEYGQIARIIEALRIKAGEMIRMQEERQSVADAREEERLHLVATFEKSLGDVVAGVASAASQLHSTAGIMVAGTDQARDQTDRVTRAMEEASSGTTAAAAASDEFAMSIGEISRQASNSAALARRASDAAVDADHKISRLSAAAGEIGEIVDLIQSIAQRTNLLALNASIEAARGGEAGRGFAVVAAEVKDLAAQTSRATQQVAQQIASMQASTGQSVEALQSIGEQVKELELTAISIASAVDQQSIAGQDLARSLDLAARATDDVSASIGQVRDASRNNGIAATQVLQSADELERQAGALRNKSLELARQFRSGRS